MSPNCQRLAFTFKGTDLSSTGGHTYCLSLRDANKCEYDCSLFQNNLLLERLGIRVMNRAVGYMAFRRALSINLLPLTILAFVYKCVSLPVAIHLVQIQIEFSRGVQPIFRDICFSCSRAGSRNIFAVSPLTFVSKRLFSFTV